MKRIFQSAKSIKNDDSCIHDSNYGYNCEFTINGNVEGWDVYDNVYLYGCWNRALFGTASATTCYIGRTEKIVPVSAEDFSIFRMMVKIEAPYNSHKNPPSKGRIYWKTSSDDSWSDTKSETFNIDNVESWFLCELHMNGHQYWSNYITDLRISLFEEGYEGISFAIRYIRLVSKDTYRCLNTQCSYYSKYAHPCKGTGCFSSALAGEGKSLYTTISGVSDELIVNIDGYGDEIIHLGNNKNVSGKVIAKKIAEHINRVDIGSYSYASVEHTDENKLKINSGFFPVFNRPIDLSTESEFKLFIHSYSISSEFVEILESKGLNYSGNISYLHVIHGDIIPFLEILYQPLLEYRTDHVMFSIAEYFMEEGYFTDILSIRASERLNLLKATWKHSWNGDYHLDIDYDALSKLYIVSGTDNNDDGVVSLKDNTNDIFIYENSPEEQVSSTISGTKSITFSYGGNHKSYFMNTAVISVGDEVEPIVDLSGGSSYFHEKYEIVEKVSGSWLNSYFRVSTETTVFSDTVLINGGSAAEELGFYTGSEENYTTTGGVLPATGFEFSSSRRLKYFEISKLIENDLDSLSYVYDPNIPEVSAGRRDYFESLSTYTNSISISEDYYSKIEGMGKIIIDFTHPVTDCGRLNKIVIGGKVNKGVVASVLIFRPLKDGTLVCIGSSVIPERKETSVYSRNPRVIYCNLNFLVSKGDLIGFSNIDLTCVHSSLTKLPNAVVCVINDSIDVSNPFSPGENISQGVVGPSYYAYSERNQKSIKLNIDVGKRLNLERFDIKCKENVTFFEYNLAACLDVSWSCDLFGEKHTHLYYNYQGLVNSVVHNNKYFGLESLDDCLTTEDMGKAGDSYSRTSDGLETYGTHTYFYVNGDAEWLNDFDRTGKAEFLQPNTGINTLHYENDPIALFFEVPQKKCVKIHKAIIYFKESPNFRKMGISYYLGDNSIERADGIIGYKYIDNIRSVYLDGNAFYPEKDVEGWTPAKFLTTNPLPDSRLVYKNGECINSDLFRVVGSLYWNVFEYNFDPVNAYGFMLYSDWHKSTKITEIEVYSRLNIKPTSLDSIFVQTSVFGEVWDSLVFSESEEEKDVISAFIPASPRYINIEISPKNKIDIYGFSTRTDDSGLGSINCKDLVVPESAKNGYLSSVSVTEIENIYNVPLNLYVNIPKDLIASKDLLSWIRFDSEETSINAEVGPGALIHKNEDYPLVSHSNQVAINSPSYYLKNLIDNKTAYTYENDSSWSEYGQLHAGEPVGYSSVPDGFLSKYNFDAVSSKYWKVLFGDITVRPIKGFKLLIGDSEVYPSNAYIQSEPSDKALYKIPMSFDSFGVICNTDVLKYEFKNNLYLDVWQPFISPGASFSYDEEFGMSPVILSSGTYGTFSTNLVHKPNSFITSVDFTYLSSSYYTKNELIIELWDSVDTQAVFVHFFAAGLRKFKVSVTSYSTSSTYDLTNYPVGHNETEEIAFSKIVELEGKLKLEVKKTSNIIEYINVTNRDGSNILVNIIPERTFFSSRLHKVKFTIKNDTDFNLPSCLPPVRNSYENVRTVIFDCFNTWGGNLLGIRSVEFFDFYGQQIEINNDNVSCFTSSIFSTRYYPIYAFNTSLSKVGGDDYCSWVTESNVAGARLICVFSDLIDFNEIVINNYHKSGTATNRGVKDIKIYVTDEVYVDDTFNTTISGASLIYDGEIKEHVYSDVVDDELITISGTGPNIIPRTDEVLKIGVSSFNVEALPVISRYESVVFGFSSSVPLNAIQISTIGKGVSYSVIKISNDSDYNYSVWARNTTKLRYSYNNHSMYEYSGYSRRRYYSSYTVQYPYLASERIYAEQHRNLFWHDDQLPMWLSYDFGDGNLIEIHSIWFFYRSTIQGVYHTKYDFPPVIYVYGSNDINPDWNTKVKDLLAIHNNPVPDQYNKIKLNSLKPYRYYCLYAPNLESSTDVYSFTIDHLMLFEFFDSTKLEYNFYRRKGNSPSYYYSIEDRDSDLYFDNSVYYGSGANGVHLTLDLGGFRYISGISFSYCAGQYCVLSLEYLYLEYSINSTDGVDGDWTFICPLNNSIEYKDSSGETLFFFIGFVSVYASWFRIKSFDYIPTTSTKEISVCEIMPILGQLPSKLTIENNYYDNYFVVDFDDIYSIDFIRNVGDFDNLLNLFDVEVSYAEELSEEEEGVVGQVEEVEVFTFNSPGTFIWTSPSEDNVSIDVLIVGGGGAGGYGINNNKGGGGGAGGLIYLEDVEFTKGSQYTIVVGAGGDGTSTQGNGANGENSEAFGHVAFGGGGGGGMLDPLNQACSQGGSGGGAVGIYNSTSYFGCNGVEGQGNSGGKSNTYSSSIFAASGGGGGAGGPGYNATYDRGGRGGNGLLFDISGNLVHYAGGGGGATHVDRNNSGQGGSGIGGRGATYSLNATSGIDGTGSGGGGSGDHITGPSGSGGCGIVIIKQKKYNEVTSVFYKEKTDLEKLMSRILWKPYVMNSNVDARWIRIPIRFGESTEKAIQKLDVYPDISKAYRKNGGHNCEWGSLGNSLTNYAYSINVSPKAKVYEGDAAQLQNVKSIIVDIGSNYEGVVVALTSIEIFDQNSDRIDLIKYDKLQNGNFRAYSSNATINTSKVENIFDVDTPNTGNVYDSSYAASYSAGMKIRVVCVLDDPVVVSKISVQNGHSFGEDLGCGVKDIGIFVSSDEVTSLIYGDYSMPLFNVFIGILPMHIAFDVEDRFIIDLQETHTNYNYFGDFGPYNCLQGDSNLEGYENSWGFKSPEGESNPILELELDDSYSISTFKITHAPENNNYVFKNKEYKIYGRLTNDDEYSELFHIVNNDKLYREHVLDIPIELKYIILEIIDYTIEGNNYYYDDETGNPILITGGFVREFEIWTNTGSVAVNSEDHPVVCIDLREAFPLSSHELITLKETINGNYALPWYDEEEFFSYSDESVDFPNEVSFIPSSGDVVVYSYTEDILDNSAIAQELFVENSVYIPKGNYKLLWSTLNIKEEGYLTFNLDGKCSVSFTNNYIGSGWADQVNYINIEETGFYNLYITRLDSGDGSKWGVRQINIVKSVSNTRWLSVKCDTASRYSYTNDPADFGIRYLNRIRTYSEVEYRPTDYPWFWGSVISNISREHSQTMVGRYSLKIDYPTSSGVDRVWFMEGDHFGWDEDWSIKDSLDFWWYISDLDNLYIDEGGFSFGSFSGGHGATFIDENENHVSKSAKQAYYLWDFKYLDLKTGWNHISLKFDDFTYTAPLRIGGSTYLDKKLDFSDNLFTSFGIVYKGKGLPFYMLLNGFKIKRNFCDDEVVDGKHGLCLTCKDYAEIPVAGVSLYAGTIEFWTKLYADTSGVDIFSNTNSRVLFTLTNTFNDIICLTIKSSGWFEIGFGGAKRDFGIVEVSPYEYDLSGFSFSIDESFHIALVWSNQGDMTDNGDTLRLYINNTLVVSSKTKWEVSDINSSILRLGGGSTILANNNDEFGSAIFSNLKVYNYCKNDFILSTYDDVPDVGQENAPIMISKDGITFYDYNSEELPLEYIEVDPGEKVKLYTKIDKRNENRISDSGSLELDWQVIV